MAELTIDKVYARALFQVAQETNKEQQILSEVKDIVDILKRELDFKKFVNSPIISVQSKKEVLEKVFKDQISEELMNFLFILVDKGRTKHFEKIAKTLLHISREKEGMSAGIIYSVEPLSALNLEKFEGETGKLLRTKVQLENQIDKSLVGGIKILIDGKIIDASIKKRLENIGDVLN